MEPLFRVSSLVEDLQFAKAISCKLKTRTMIALGIVVFVVGLADGHMRFAFPAPRSSSTGIKEPYPCGDEGFFDAAHPVTVLQPGSASV
jgi:hypothetical protein